MPVMIGTTLLVVYLTILMEFHKRPFYTNAVIANDQELEIRNGHIAYYDRWLYVLLGGSLIFVSGFRYGFVDTPAYRFMFDHVPTTLEAMFTEPFDLSKEYGFTLFMAVLRQITTNSQILILVTTIIIIGIEFYLLQKYAIDLPFSLLIFFFMEYIDSMNIVRQLMAGMFFLLAIPLIKKKRFLSYCVVIALLCTIHMSAIVCLPLYFLLNGKVFHRAMKVTVALIFICYLLPALINTIVNTIFGADSKYAEYFNGEFVGMGIVRLLVQVAPLGLLFLYEWRKHAANCQDQVEAQPYYQIFANMMILNGALNLIGTRLVLLSRLTVYVSFGSIVLIPYLLFQLFKSKDYQIIKIIVLLAYLIFFIIQLINFNADNYLNGIRFVFWEEATP